jgi:tRNA modification GTPase
MNKTDTIFALSSGAGRAGIAVVRLSGPASGMLLNHFAGGVVKPRHASLRAITIDNEIIDQALVLWLPGPGTVTGEDMAEFHLHGSGAIVARLFSAFGEIVDLRLAEAGEFTRRAFVNGRMDLVAVEGLSDLLEAQTESQRRLAMRQFLGAASSQYDSWRSSLLTALSLIEAAIDFSDEEDVARDAVAQARAQLLVLKSELELAVAQSTRVGLLRSGVRVVIAGEPNVGKSSLLNALAMREVAIVSPQAGTTRDVIDVTLNLGGVPVILTDTAGLRDAGDDAIEAIGIGRAEAAIAEADVLLWLVSVDRPGLPGDRYPNLIVMNKCDLDGRAGAAELIQLRNKFPNAVSCGVSVRSGDGLPEFLTILQDVVSQHLGQAEQAPVVRERHGRAITQSIRYLNDALLVNAQNTELFAEHVRQSARALASITGHIDVEDMLGAIFSRFCIGK